MKVRYLHEQIFSSGGKQCSNIMWEKTGIWPMKAGTFPPEHPTLTNSDAIASFESKGYRLRPFPEGDGCALDLLEGQSREEVISDIRESFGWEVN